jgi:CRISPR-associated protein Cas6
MNTLELVFPLIATQPIPSDHGYMLFAAITQCLPELHDGARKLAVHPIRGRQIGNRMMQLTEQSRLMLRVPDGEIAPLLSLAGQQLRIGAHAVRVGVPQVRSLIPSTVQRSRLVTIKIVGKSANQQTPQLFLEGARRGLAKLGLSDQLELMIPTRPGSTSESPAVPIRRTMRVKDVEIVGYELVIAGLTADESLTLQIEGLGGKRHMGCGVFVPVRD